MIDEFNCINAVNSTAFSNNDKFPSEQSTDQHIFKINQVPLEINSNYSKQLKPTSSHVSTPIINRSSGYQLTPVLSNLKPTSSHISTPIPYRKQSISPSSNSINSINSIYTSSISISDCTCHFQSFIHSKRPVF